MHAVNFHSTIKDLSAETLKRLDEFLTQLKIQFPALRFVHDEDVWNIVQRGAYAWRGQTFPIASESFWQRSSALASRLKQQSLE